MLRNYLLTGKRSWSDNLPSSFYRFCSTSLAEPLFRLFKKSVHDGVFPDKWKIANVIPVFKSGSEIIL